MQCNRACPLSGNSGHRALFDHLIGAFEQWPRHRHTQCLRGLEIDHQLILGRRLHREIAGFFAFQNTVDVTGYVPNLVVEISPVRHQSAGGGKKAKGEDRRQFVPGGKRNDQILMKRGQRAGRHDEAAIRQACESRDGALHLGPVAYVDHGYFQAECRCDTLDDGELAGPGRDAGITNDRNASHVWRDLLEQIKPFAAQAVFEQHEARNIATRPREIVDKTRAKRIHNDREDNRRAAGSLQQDVRGDTAKGDEDVRRQRK